MKNPGLYYVRRTDTGGFGSEARWDRGVLRHNGKDLAAVSAAEEEHGIVVNGGDVMMCGKTIIKGTDGDVIDGKTNKFGDIDLVPTRRCINVTLADYNTLRAGGIPEGCRKYDPKAIYRIVDNVATATEVVVSGDVSGEDLLYNNMDGSLPHHDEDPIRTFNDMAAPQLCVFDYTHKIKPGENIEFDYMVDTRDMYGINRSQFGETFTVTVKYYSKNQARQLFKRTTYAGIFHASIGPFMNEQNNGYFEGEGWWEIQCVDSNGVGSATRYFDFWSADDAEEKVYNMTAADLTQYHIALNDSTPEQGWRNKLGLTLLMDQVAKEGYTKLRLYNPGGDSIYWIDYHKNVIGDVKLPTESITASALLDQQVDLGGQAYYIVRLYDEDGVRKYELQDASRGKTVVIDGKEFTVNEDPIEWVKHDGARLYRVGGTEADKDKIKVRWKDSLLNPATEMTVTDGYLKMWTKKRLLEMKNDRGVDYIKSTPAGYYYCYDSNAPYGKTETWKGGDNIIFPDHFTLDMNGATWRGILCNDINWGSLVVLDGRFDTHIVNGKIVGMLQGYDWKAGYLTQQGKLRSSVCEHVDNIVLAGSRYCSIENIDSSGSLGYDNRTEFCNVNQTCVGGYKTTTKGHVEEVNQLGFIDKAGNINTNDCYVAPCGTENDADSICLIHGDTYIQCPYEEVAIAHSSHKRTGIGKQLELFVSWYQQVGNAFSFIRTVKSHLYNLTKKPYGATHFRISGFGVGYHDTNTNELNITTVPISITYQGVTRTFNCGVAWERPICKCYGLRGRNNLVRGCYFHDTRSCAMAAAQNKGITFDGCRWKGIALVTDEWGITSMMGDLEEGGEMRDSITIKNCVVERYSTLDDVPDGIHAVGTGRFVLKIFSARNLLIKNNSGLTPFNFAGGVESALLINNRFYSLRARRTILVKHPAIVLKNNTLFFKFNPQTASSNDERPFMYEGPSKFYQYDDGNLKNRCDDPVDKTSTWIDSLSPDTYRYGMSVILQRSKVGDDVSD